MPSLARRKLLLTACAAAAMPLAARSQTPMRTARVGWLGWLGGSGATASRDQFAAFRDGLERHGWREGRNLILEARSGEQTMARELAGQLAGSGIDVLVCEGPMVFGARNGVPPTVPILFSINGDPVEAGLVDSLARPGGRLTGITALSAELSVKRVEYLKQCVPGLSRIAAIANQSHPGVRVEFDATHEAARRLGLAVQWLPVYGVNDFNAALEAAQRERAGAIVAVPDNLVNGRAETIAHFCTKARIPAISGWAQFAEAGNVMSYGPVLHAFFARLGGYVDMTLRGSRVSELPVERPSAFEFVVNARAAQQIGLAIPAGIAARADRTIG